ncbi:MAG: hypothetical protein MZV64_19960 [Ignavibacteriales bacterium]|nr:hypothetical protein [Ignavibacteriales bacterium]
MRQALIIDGRPSPTTPTATAGGARRWRALAGVQRHQHRRGRRRQHDPGPDDHAAFAHDGINVASGADNVTIAGNWIGTHRAPASHRRVGNGDDGIDIAGSNAIIGGTGANDRNVITNSGDEGIDIDGSGVTGHLIQGNYIGVDPDGVDRRRQRRRRHRDHLGHRQHDRRHDGRRAQRDLEEQRRHGDQHRPTTWCRATTSAPMRRAPLSCGNRIGDGVQSQGSSTDNTDRRHGGGRRQPDRLQRA